MWVHPGCYALAVGRYIEELVAEAVALPTNGRVVFFESLGRTLAPQ